jgi:hypothetical protein
MKESWSARPSPFLKWGEKFKKAPAVKVTLLAKVDGKDVSGAGYSTCP